MNKLLVGMCLVTMVGCGKVENALQDNVAQDLIEQYEIAKRQGNAMDTCTHAGAVAMTYLSAKDEANYAKWTATQEADCAAVMPTMDN